MGAAGVGGLVIRDPGGEIRPWLNDQLEQGHAVVIKKATDPAEGGAGDDPDALKARIRELEWALGRYGQHATGCRGPWEYKKERDVVCSCGLASYLQDETREQQAERRRKLGRSGRGRW